MARWMDRLTDDGQIRMHILLSLACMHIIGPSKLTWLLGKPNTLKYKGML